MVLKLLSCVILLVSLIVPVEGNKRRLKNEIDGIYLFKSETTVTSKPNAKSVVRKAPDWDGIYVFSKGVFTRSLVNKNRNGDWVGFFPSNYSELGFESQTGTYEIEGSTLVLDIRVGLNPFEYDSRERLDARFQGDELVITKKLRPHIEDLRDGSVTTILTRVDAAKVKGL